MEHGARSKGTVWRQNLLFFNLTFVFCKKTNAIRSLRLRMVKSKEIFALIKTFTGASWLQVEIKLYSNND